jgi:hypothetical protein
MAAMFFLLKFVEYIRTRRLIHKIELEAPDYDVVFSDPKEKDDGHTRRS